MKMSNLKSYLEDRTKIEASITKGILEAISSKIKNLPEDGKEELGACIISASTDISETILSIIAQEQDEDYDDYDDEL